MSYQPPSDQDRGDTSPEGGYTPPASSGGSYTPPPAPSEGDYTPSAPTGGDYTPPPAPTGGDYTPPPATGGGSYTPPPPATGGSSYTPPPMTTGSSYNPAPSSSMTTTGGGSSDMSHLPQSYINAVTKPNVGTYEAEIPNANLIKTLIGVTIVAVVTFIFTLLGAGASAAGMSSVFSQFGGAGAEIDPAALGFGTGVVGAITGLFVTFIAFFIGAGIQYLTAKMLGGQGQDFTTHAYLTSLSYTPLNAVAAAVNIIPGIGPLIGIVLTIYRLYLQGLSLQASQRLAPGKAMLAAFMPFIIGLVLVCLIVVACAGLIASMIGAANANP